LMEVDRIEKVMQQNTKAKPSVLVAETAKVADLGCSEGASYRRERQSCDG
jgi:hypothetical protein